MPVITLFTDFGLSDPYVGMMKGVILSITPHVSIVDVSHYIDPQDLCAAAYLLDAAYPYFPQKTVHMVVVDPGVGSSRKIIAAEAGGHYFLAPDNGVLTKIIDGGDVRTLVRVENPEYFRQPVSRTFHGRDIFAPVAAHMASGKPLDGFGPRVCPVDLSRLELSAARLTEAGELLGEVIAVDRFGNLITNIDQQKLLELDASEEGGNLCVHIGEHRINGLSASYQDVSAGGLLSIIGSRGCLEISVNSGDARAYCEADKGAPVRVARIRER
ncbi:MAG: SAM-dependent chlorinase/fluorinase [Desulfobacterales bacterium]|nr:SAM-dependent chlorinase/fluorinase [Desulfobacterales bacterium]